MTLPPYPTLSPAARALHDAVDAHARMTRTAHLNPDGPSIQRDLLGSEAMIAWQEAKAAYLFDPDGCWSELPHIYARYGTDATRALLATLRSIYDAKGAILTDSGMSAIGLLADAWLTRGAHVVMTRQVYNKTRTLLRHQLERVGGELTEVPDGDPQAVAPALRPETRLIFTEHHTNPLTRAQDLPALAAVRDAAGLPELRLAVDDTALTPWGPRTPLLAQGADVVVGSATKALSGDDGVLGGYIVGRDLALMNRVMDIQAMRGGVLGEPAAGRILAGLPRAELDARIRSATATALADFLAAHPAVESVFHPSRPDHPDAAVIARDWAQPGALMAFRLRDLDDAGHRHAADVLAMTRVFRYALSFDGLVSKVNHHTTVSEYFTPPPVLRGLGLDRLIRLAPGLEPASDLIAALAWTLTSHRDVPREAVLAWQAARSAELGLAR